MGDQEIKCQFSWIEPKKMMVTDDAGVETEKDGSNKADICYVKVKINKDDGGKYKDIQVIDSRLTDFEGKGDNDKWNKEQEEKDGYFNCKFDEAASKLNVAEDGTFEPVLAMSRPLMAK